MIGILAYAGCSAETLEDYSRLAFYLGRRCQEYDFFLSVISKAEQFRGRNNIVEAAIGVGSQYLLMLDDDHVIDIDNRAAPSERYDFVRKFINAMEKDPTIGIIGALYFQRGGFHHPVMMKLGVDGKYYWLKKEDITHGMQEVDVTGGGCILINMKIFDRIVSPWFEPEFHMGTDVQICSKTKAQGFKVYCDTSVEIGHVKNVREIITSKTAGAGEANTHRMVDRMNDDWALVSMRNLYNMDVEEYLEMKPQEINELAKNYQSSIKKHIKYFDNKEEYYRSLGKEQVARQYWFHNRPESIDNILLQSTLNVLDGQKLRGLDFGCGTSPIGFEMLKHGYEMDFVDVDGAPAYDFLKWRVKKRSLKAGWKWSVDANYDFILLFDALEHIEDWETILENIVKSMRGGGYIITNYFTNNDRMNPEHISMDHEAVRNSLIAKKVYPITLLTWRKHGEIEPGVWPPLPPREN
uniref:Putative methyltransferase n=1 Tax=viral metagenome TaxID=1070528 RepID=A0A6M3K611_9ZZZZ